MSAQVYSVPDQLKGEERRFWNGFNYYKSVHHPIPTSDNSKYPKNEISKLCFCFQLSVQIHSLLGQTEGCKKGSHIVRLPQRATGCQKKWNSLSFCKI